MAKDWRNAALVLVGHGSARHPESAAPTSRLARELRQRSLFAEVCACFWKQSPYVGEALSMVNASEIYVVPNFAGEGYFTREVIPREMNLSGPVTRRETRTLYYTPPIGAHPRIGQIVRRRAEAVIAEKELDPQQVCLLLVGHGSTKPGGSSRTARALAELLRAAGLFGETHAMFLEEEPKVTKWWSLVRSKYVVVEPLLIGEGLHGGQDLPPLFGLTEEAWTKSDSDALFSKLGDKNIWMCRGIGSDPEIADIIIDQLRQFDLQNASG